jgi:hypothetical protein
MSGRFDLFNPFQCVACFLFLRSFNCCQLECAFGWFFWFGATARVYTEFRLSWMVEMILRLSS